MRLGDGDIASDSASETSETASTLETNAEEVPDSGLLHLDGRVKVFLPPHVFEFTWNEAYDPAQGLVRFDLVELDGDRTQLTLINTVPSRHGTDASAGWRELMDRLRRFAETGAPVQA